MGRREAAVVTWLISMTGLSIVPGVYIAAAALVAIAILAWMRDCSREALR